MKTISLVFLLPLTLFGQMYYGPLRKEKSPAPAGVAFGRNMGGDEGCTVMGDDAIAEKAAVAIGASSGAGRRGVAIGMWAYNALDGVAIGYDATAGTNAVAIGAGAVAGSHRVQLGWGTNTTAMLKVGKVELLSDPGYVPYATLDPQLTKDLDFIRDSIASVSNVVSKNSSRLIDKSLGNALETASWLELDGGILYHISVTCSNDIHRFTNKVAILSFIKGTVSLNVKGESSIILPKSPVGLSSGMIWNDSGTVKVIP